MVNVEIQGVRHHNNQQHADCQYSRQARGHVGMDSQPQMSAWHLAVAR
jgi:hypothetical protein